MKVLLTGANSMLGGNVVEALTVGGFEIVALVRRSNELIDRCCDVVIGDVSDIEVLREVSKGCDAIVHIAGVTDQMLLHLDAYRFNWVAAENIGQVASELGITKVVFISSANTIGNGASTLDANENTPLQWPYSKSLYGQSKVLAEQKLVARYPDAIIVNPTFMIGKYDSKPSSGQMIKRGFAKRLVFVPPGGKNFVPAKEVAQFIVTLLSRSVPPGRYIAGGVEWSFKRFMTTLSELYGYKTWIIVLPKWSIILAGLFGDVLRFLGFKVSFSGVNMSILNQKEYYSSEKAKQEGLLHSPLDDAIRDATDWMLQNGALQSDKS